MKIPFSCLTTIEDRFLSLVKSILSKISTVYSKFPTLYFKNLLFNLPKNEKPKFEAYSTRQISSGELPFKLKCELLLKIKILLLLLIYHFLSHRDLQLNKFKVNSYLIQFYFLKIPKD